MCLFALLAAFAPRLAFLFLWLFTPLVDRAFHGTVVWPLLGMIVLPFTSLMYALVYNPVVGVTGWGWVWVFLALVLDLGAYTSSAYGNRSRIRGLTAY